MKCKLLLVFVMFINYNYAQITYRKVILKAKKTTIVCDKEKMEPPFDVTVIIDSSTVKIEIFGYGQASRYNFR